MSNVKRRYGLFKPQNYDLSIEPDIETLTFKGQVGIVGVLEKPRKNIALHSHELEITDAWVVHGQKRIALSEIRPNVPEQEVNLIFTDIIPKGQLVIWVEFSGQIDAKMQGLYPSHFTHEGKTQTLLSTQLEAIHARELFPCIDEPEAKATFDLKLKVPRDATALANTPQKKTSVSGELKTVEFETTPKMSTYLLAFVIGELEYVRRKSGDTEVRVYATPGNRDRAQFAAKTAAKMLKFYNEYFSIPYPLPKLDLVAIPHFAAGAMENWGLITFREAALLVDEEHSSLATQQRVATIIAHELAHQWFGNLVTMRWWTDLWLNEGFATWIEYLAVDKVFPKWRIWEQFVSQEYTFALREDALANTHPIEVEIDDPEEINEIFDAISYQKGACVIRMLHDYMGAEKFRQGLSDYLKQFAYGNAKTEQLWKALEKSSRQPVVKFMGSWVEQPGYPVVKVDAEESGAYKLQQQPFILSPTERQTAPRRFWPVPISASGTNEETLLLHQSYRWEVKLKAKDFLKLNQGQAGFYRVQYSSNLLSELSEPIASKKMEAVDRFGVLADTFELAKSGFCPSGQWLELLSHYQDEDSPIVWNALASGLVQLYRFFSDKASLEGLLKSFSQDFIYTQYQRLGWKVSDKDSHFDRLLRGTILNLAVTFQHKEALSEAYSLFKRQLKGKPPHPDIRGAVYRAIAKRDTQSGYSQLLGLYQSAELAEERQRLIPALTSYQDKQLFRQSLDLITTPEVLPHEVTYWISSSLSNHYHKELAWQWLQEHWDWYLERYRQSHDVSTLIKSLGYTFGDAQVAQEIEKFFEKRGYKGVDRSVSQALELIRLQAEWRQRDEKDIGSALREISLN